MTPNQRPALFLAFVGLLWLARGCGGASSSDSSPSGDCRGGSCSSAVSSGGSGGCSLLPCAGAAGSSEAGASGSAAAGYAAGSAGHAGKAATAGSAGATDANGCPIYPLPKDIPEDWTQYTGISCDCPLFVPGSSKTMPPPLSWAPCAGALEGKFACRVLEHPWNTYGLFPVTTALIHDEVTDRYLLSFSKSKDLPPYTRIELTADIDGDVRFAIGAKVESNSPLCSLYESHVNSTSFAYAFDRKGKDKNYEGMISGDFATGLPQHIIQTEEDPNLGSSWDFSSTLLLQRLGWVHAWSWDLSTSTNVYDALTDAPHLGKHNVIGYKDSVILGVGGDSTQALVSWTKEKGVQTLLYWPSEYKGAFNPGTDGQNLVWTYGEGPATTGV